MADSATKRNTDSADILRLRVTLLGTRPRIWRRLLIRARLRLARLHHVLQVSMGWEDYHLHEFRAGDRRFEEAGMEDDFPSVPPAEDERQASIGSLLARVGAEIIYTYDLGDNWEHGIVLEARLRAEPGVAYPVCTGGAGACPPEDCGGITGFHELLRALRNPRHEEHERMREWVGDGYDPKAFSLEGVNQLLARPRLRAARRRR